jgi:hypothetical protein
MSENKINSLFNKILGGNKACGCGTSWLEEEKENKPSQEKKEIQNTDTEKSRDTNNDGCG